MKNQIAIRAYYWNKETQVYTGTIEEWKEYLNREVQTIEDVIKGFKYKECGLNKVKPALRYKNEEAKSIEPLVIEIRTKKELKEKMLQEQRAEEQRLNHQLPRFNPIFMKLNYKSKKIKKETYNSPPYLSNNSFNSLFSLLPSIVILNSPSLLYGLISLL